MGNQSPEKQKYKFPDSYYCGSDVSEARPGNMSILQTGIFNANPNHSASALHLDEEFDVVISSHNLEHCFHRWSTLESMADRVKSGEVQSIFAFPAEISVNFPSRGSGCLNYYDNVEHLDSPN